VAVGERPEASLGRVRELVRHAAARDLCRRRREDARGGIAREDADVLTAQPPRRQTEESSEPTFFPASVAMNTRKSHLFHGIVLREHSGQAANSRRSPR
jgi:hypothetical protein